MSTNASPRPDSADDEKKIAVPTTELRAADGGSLQGDDVLGLQDLDPALNMKMHIVNDAMDQIGWTSYHMKLFFLNGFGYAVDSLILLCQSIIARHALNEFRAGWPEGLNVAVYSGMLAGALFWGLGADIIGRKYAFNCSLFICSVSCILAGAMPNWGSLGFFISLLGFGGGGNLILDTTVFLEYLPGDKQWLVTFLASWWGLGQSITGFIGWTFLAPEKWNCPDLAKDQDPATYICDKDQNWGWRYVMFTSGVIVLVMSILRVTVVHLKETPKYLLVAGEDEKVVETLQAIAKKYNRPCSITLEKLEACGVVQGQHSTNKMSLDEYLIHFRGLFCTRKMALSTTLIWFSWLLIGLAYPLFYVFLYTYLSSKGADLERSTYTYWRDYALTNVTGIFGPFLGAWLCERPFLGRRGAMAIGALMSGAFFFAFTAVRTGAQNLAISCLIGFCVNVYYGTLYAYTPEVLPSAHRATGNGIAVVFNRIMGIMSAIVASYANTETSAPIYICAALFIVMALVSISFPFEPYGHRSS